MSCRSLGLLFHLPADAIRAPGVDQTALGDKTTTLVDNLLALGDTHVSIGDEFIEVGAAQSAICLALYVIGDAGPAPTKSLN